MLHYVMVFECYDKSMPVRVVHVLRPTDIVKAMHDQSQEDYKLLSLTVAESEDRLLAMV